MADGTILTKGTVVFVFTLVTGIAVLGSASIDIVHMTAGACHAGMRPGQFEDGKVMVKTCAAPGLGDMARFAVLTKSPIMLIILQVATNTSGRGALVDIVNMAACTGNADMFAGQFERR